MHTYTYIYIYIKRTPEDSAEAFSGDESDGQKDQAPCSGAPAKQINVCIYIYIYIYIERERYR